MTTTQPVLDAGLKEKLQQALPQLVEQYRADPESARAEFRASTRAVRGFLTESRSRDFSQRIDEPEALGGTDQGPNPVEVLLGALGTCQEIVIVAYAAVLGIELEEVNIDVRGELDLRGLFNVADVPAGFKSVHFDADIRARDATEEQLEQLRQLALAHCPVLDTLERPVAVTNHYTLSSAVAAGAARAG